MPTKEQVYTAREDKAQQKLAFNERFQIKTTLVYDNEKQSFDEKPVSLLLLMLIV